MQTETLGLRVLGPLATALTLARELRHEALVQVVDALLTPSRWYLGLALPREAEQPYATPEQLDAFIERCGGLAGVSALRAAAADARVGVDPGCPNRSCIHSSSSTVSSGIPTWRTRS